MVSVLVFEVAIIMGFTFDLVLVLVSEVEKIMEDCLFDKMAKFGSKQVHKKLHLTLEVYCNKHILKCKLRCGTIAGLFVSF